jgi:hypothetical protein
MLVIGFEVSYDVSKTKIKQSAIIKYDRDWKHTYKTSDNTEVFPMISKRLVSQISVLQVRATICFITEGRQRK